MCGIVGYWTKSNLFTQDFSSSIIKKMTNSLQHRGPDDDGYWVDYSDGIAFGHRRLSIVELSAAGHQPMLSDSKRFLLIFNGEIYNHLDLRNELISINYEPLHKKSLIKWRGNSDTETLLACFENWGIEETLKKTIGMFALALWDIQEKKLYLARDRFGEKPLYYGWTGTGDNKVFLFGSELKAIRAFPEFNNGVCREALAEYMRYSVVPAPLSIYADIYKLEPGCLLSLSESSSSKFPSGVTFELVNQQQRSGNFHFELLQKGILKIQKWWSLSEVAIAETKSPFADEKEAITALDNQLHEAVKLQSIADVPLGAFLSGGVDSSTVVALMQNQSNRPVNTFTIGFNDADFDEAPFARAVAKHLGTDHHELHVTSQMAKDVIFLLPKMYDEPFGDSSQIPTYLVSQFARNQVTVALSGDGGDELFGGYNRYFWGPRIWNRLSWIPYPLRQALGVAIAKVPVKTWDTLAIPVNAFLTGNQGLLHVGDKAHNFASRLRSVKSLDELLRDLATVWTDPSAVVRMESCEIALQSFSFHHKFSDILTHEMDPVAKMMFTDSMTYLPNDILCKVDRAAMACGLETRVPFLDHRVAELAWRLPMHMKVRGNTGKWALRQVLYKYVPKELIERPKAGFAIPIGRWLRGPLRDWAEALLSEQRLQVEGYFYSQPIRTAWNEHIAGTRDHTAKLWTVLMFQAWLEDQN